MKRRKRKIKRNNLNKQKNIIIISVFSLCFMLSIGYAAFSTNMSLNVKGNVLDRSRTIRFWSRTSNEDFHSEFYRENIVSVTFLDTAKVPNSATQSWDVSQDGDKGVMAYVAESQNETGKYDLFIGAKHGVIANKDSANLFFHFINLKSIQFNNNFDTSNVKSMQEMFGGGNSVEILDISSFNTANVTTMTGMFTAWNTPLGRWENGSIKKIIFGKDFITSNVTSMSDMFSGQPIKELDLSNFDTSNVTTFYHTFNQCEDLTTLVVNNFNTSKVTDMRAMFANCSKLAILDLSSFTADSLIYMSDMFYNNKSLNKILFGNFITNKVTNMVGVFNYCENLKTINLCSLDTSVVTDASLMFANAYSLENVYVNNNWDLSLANTNNIFANSRISSVTTGLCS